MRDGWQMVRLSDVAITARSHGVAEGGHPYIGLEHLDGGVRRVVRWGDTSEVSSAVTEFQPGDTLFSKLRPYLNKVVRMSFGGFCTNELLVFRPVDSSILHASFLSLLLQSDQAIRHAVASSAGTRMPRTSSRLMGRLSVRIPPLVEQRRIVDLIAAVDDAIRSSDVAVRYKENAYLAVADSLHGNSVEVGSLLERIEVGKSPGGEDREPTGSELAVLKVSAVGQWEFVPSEVKVVLDHDLLPENTRVRSGDLLLARASGALERVGAVCEVDTEPLNRYLCDKTMRLVLHEELVHPQWFLAALRSRRGRSEIEAVTTGSDMRNISQKALRSVRIPVASAHETVRIGNLLAAMSSSRRTVLESKRRLQDLRAQLLTVLLSGAHEIPESYDALLEEMA